jgi:hypothetical protein
LFSKNKDKDNKKSLSFAGSTHNARKDKSHSGAGVHITNDINGPVYNIKRIKTDVVLGGDGWTSTSPM